MQLSDVQLVHVMFQAACDAAGYTVDEAYDLGADPHDYCEIARTLAQFIENHEAEAIAVAKLILERKQVSSFFTQNPIRRGPPSRILP